MQGVWVDFAQNSGITITNLKNKIMKLLSSISKNILLLMLGVSGSLAYAQEENGLKNFHFSGSADVFYKYDSVNQLFHQTFLIPKIFF